MDKIMELAEKASDLIVERLERDRKKSPELSTEALFNEIARNSPSMGPKTAELARMKLGIE